MLFTATPISGGARDILSLVGLLGAENFTDETLDVLESLEMTSLAQMSSEEILRLRREIGSFTVRRTKAQFNELVEREPDRYVHPLTGKICRYPAHELLRYKTEETELDSEYALRIDAVAQELVGIGFLDQGTMTPPKWWTSSAWEWARARLRSSAGLARYNVLATLRSSRAALGEHLVGTEASEHLYEISAAMRKTTTSRGMIAKLAQLQLGSPPTVDGAGPEHDDEVVELLSAASWGEQCQGEIERYQEILRLLKLMSSAREEGKATLLARLNEQHARVLAFDAHPITLAVLSDLLRKNGREVTVATGEGGARAKQRVGELFAAHSSVTMIALCSDALNEGLNLQGASAVVHLDVPSTLRVAEQRVGRVDRLDSPYDKVEIYWPSDGQAFLTSADRLLERRAVENDRLLGSNIDVPGQERLTQPALPEVSVDESDLERFGGELESVPPSFEIIDAFDPIRALVGGDRPLIDPQLYRRVGVLSRSRRLMAVVQAERPWLFVEVSSGVGGLPRWMLAEAGHDAAVLVDLVSVSKRLRELLHAEERIGRAVSDSSLEVLAEAVSRLRPVEFDLLPQRLRKGFLQLQRVVTHRFELVSRKGDVAAIDRWREIVEHVKVSRGEAGSEGSEVYLDAGSLGQLWLDRVRPHLDAARSGQVRRRRFVALRDIEADVLAEEIDPVELLTAFEAVPTVAPFSERMKIAIIGDPRS
jgi:CheY-like chemotaxis protein